MSDKTCWSCGDRAMYTIEPSGEYDWLGWDVVPVCGKNDCLTERLASYANEITAPLLVTALWVVQS